MKMKMYGHMNSPSSTKRNSILTRLFRRPSQAEKKTQLNKLPPELMLEIANHLRRNKNVESAHLQMLVTDVTNTGYQEMVP